MKKLGLALGSGAARGYAHIGVIKVLEKNKIPIDFISGSSMGAVVAAYYALKKDIELGELMALDLRKADLLRLTDINNPKKSIIKGEKIRSFLYTLLGNKTFKDTKIPLRIAATCLEDGSEVVFSSGKIIDAVMASISFPGVFLPVIYKNMHLIDGGFSDAVPASPLFKIGAEAVVAVDLYSLGYEIQGELDFKKTIARTYEIILAKFSLYHERKNNKIIVINPSSKENIGHLDFDKAQKSIELGEREAIKKLKAIQKMLK